MHTYTHTTYGSHVYICLYMRNTLVPTHAYAHTLCAPGVSTP